MHTLAALQPQELGIYIPFAAIAIAPLIIFIVLHFQTQRRRLWHETARIALEKGQPVPADGEAANKDKERLPPSPLRDVRRGLILLAVSGALYLTYRHAGTLLGSYLTGGIGLALLLNALLTVLFAPKSSDSSQRPPQA